MEAPDTIQSNRIIYPINSPMQFLNTNNEVVRSYMYDNEGRIVRELNNKGKERYSVTYDENGAIKIKKINSSKNIEYYSWIKKDSNHRIINNYNESNKKTFEFKYDTKGRMIESKSWFKGRDANYRTYEYVENNSR